MKRILLLLLCLPLLAWAQTLEIIPLQHRSAEEVLPALRPFIEPGGTLGGKDSMLFLRASRRNQTEIRRLLDELDIPPRRLMISVRHENANEQDSRGLKVGAGRTASVYSAASNGELRVLQQVQTIDGGQATIRLGESFFLPLHQVILTPAGVVVATSIVQRDLGSGFTAAPRLAGNTVTLAIAPSIESAGALPGSMQIERLTTTLSGPLGEWLALGGAVAEESSQNNSLAGKTTSWHASMSPRQRRRWAAHCEQTRSAGTAPCAAPVQSQRRLLLTVDEVR